MHTYYYAGDWLVRETWGSNTLDFYYDQAGRPYALKHNGTTYYYILNLQGDVMALVDSTKTQVAAYTYDPWGKVLTATGSLAAINPLRYRGYYQDSETGFYYLQSRYYDPQIGRFLNADSYASTGQGILGHNMFAYCNNNPVKYSDSSGVAPFDSVDSDGDGVVDYYVYAYEYYFTYYLFGFNKPISVICYGFVYIYVGKDKAYIHDSANHPSKYNEGTDLLVVYLPDYSPEDDTNMYAYNAHKIQEDRRDDILRCLLAFDEDMDTPWERTIESLHIEWKGHDRYAWASASAKHIDFNNKEEGKNLRYYDKKAIRAFLNKIKDFVSG